MDVDNDEHFIDRNTYKFVNDEVYTEDDVLVYNIIVNYSLKNIPVQDVTKYFKKFGEIVNINMVVYEEKISCAYCLVHFAEAKSAAKVLQKRYHIIKNNLIKVTPRHTWCQPDGQRIIQQLTNYQITNSLPNYSNAHCATSINSENPPLVFTLNDDCLEYIYKKLPLKDQLNFALTSQRFCDIFTMLAEAEYVTVKTSKFTNLTPWEIRVFLQIVGSQIKSLKIDHLIPKECLKFISLFCKNVEQLKVKVDIKANSLRILIQEMPLLKEFSLFDEDINVSDKWTDNLKSIKELKSLEITNNQVITGKNLKFLSGLEKLSLDDCINLNAFHFRKICVKNKNLLYLDIRYCDNLKTCDYEHILENLTQLETIKISTSEDFSCIAKLPKLKSLVLTGCCFIPEEFLSNLATHQATQLEVLKLTIFKTRKPKNISSIGGLKKLKVLHCNSIVTDESLESFSNLSELEEVNFRRCHEITDKGVLGMLENIRKLKRLYFYDCGSLTFDLLRNAFKLLQDQRDRWVRDDQVHIFLTDYTGTFVHMIEKFSKKDFDVLKVTIGDVNHPYSDYFPRGVDDLDGFYYDYFSSEGEDYDN